MTAAVAILTLIVLAGGAVTNLAALWRATRAAARGVGRVGRAAGRAGRALGQTGLAYLRLPAHVATIARDLVGVRSAAQLALEEWKGSSQLMASTVLDHEDQLKSQGAELDEHGRRISRLEELANLTANPRPKPFVNPQPSVGESPPST